MVMQQKIAVPTGQLAADDGAMTVIRLEPAGPVRVPNGNFLISAQFERVGDDLLLIGRDGGRVLVVDYFAGSSPPTLVSEYGAEISGDLAEKLAGPSSPGAYAQAGGAAGRPAIGAVEALTGDATALHTDGSRVPLAIGAPVFQGDVVETAPGSRLAIVFNDRTTFTLDSATRMVLDELVYNPGGEGRSAFSLVQGTFVYISGEIAKAAPQNVQIRTPVATVGIRGTEVGFVILGPGDAGGASITVLEGEIAVRNTAGSQILTAGFAVSVSSTFAAPSAPIATPLSNIISQYGALRGYGSNAINNSIIRLQREQQQLQLQAPPAPGHGTGPVTGGMRAASGQAGSSQGDAGQAKQGEQAAALAGIAPAAGQAGEAAAGTTTTGSIFGPSAMIAGPAGLVAVGALINLGTITQNGQLANLDQTRLMTTGEHRATAAAAAAPSALIAVPDQSASTPGNGTMQIDVLANDTTPPTGGITIVAVDTTNTLGSVTIDPSGTSVTYSPGNAFQSLGAGQTATDTFTYTIADASGVQSTATVTVTVTGVNDPPVAADDAVAAAAGGPTEILPLANDTDPDNGDSKTIVAVDTTGTLGSVTITGGGAAISYDPGSAFQGLGAGQTATDTFTYTMADSAGAQSTATVTVSIGGANDAPTAVADTAAVAAGDATAILALANDTDPDTGDSKTIVAVNTAGALGSVAITGGGTGLSYSAGAAFQNLGAGQTATDTFSYTMADGSGAQSTATVTVTITGVNDAPTAVDDAATAAAGATVAIAPLTNDTDPDTGDSKTIVTVNTAGTLGSVAITGGGTGLSYDTGGAFSNLAAGQTATDTFTYTIADSSGAQSTAAVTVTIVGGNDAPTAVDDVATATAGGAIAIAALSNDTDPDNGDSKTIVSVNTTGTLGSVQITGSGSGLSYSTGTAFQSLGAGQTATDSFTYTMADAAGVQSTATVTVTVSGVNDAPTAVNDAATVIAGEVITIAALANDIDPDSGDSKTIVAVDTTGTLGSVGISVGSGGITYSSGTAFRSLGAGQTATDTFTYTMRDAAGAQSTATVTVTVVGVNDAPTDIALSGSTVAENAAIGTLVGTVAATDVDAGDSITFSLIDNAGGAFVLDGNAIRVAGAIDYEASTTRQITIRATDAAGAFYDETLSIAVTNVNEAPSITSNGGGASAAITMLEATTAVTTVAASDPDSGTTFTFAIVGGADASHFAINSATGELTFFPPPIFEVPTDSDGNNIYDVTVLVSDGSLRDTQSIAVTVIDDPNVDPNDFDYLGLPGTQVLTGSGGSNDLFYGGAGNDVINGHTGGDTIYGGSGDDVITASGDNPDLIFGGSGNDRIEAGQSGDTLTGGLGNDTLQGGQGNDVLEGSAGNDSITGGQGADRIVGGAGADIMDGGQGADQFVFNGLTDVTVIASNQTAAQAGLPINSILDFDSGVDSLVFNSAVFSPDAPLVLIGGAYDGTSSVVPAGPAFVLDGNGLLSYDPDVATEGYVAVAQLGDVGLEGPDLQFSPPTT